MPRGTSRGGRSARGGSAHQQGRERVSIKSQSRRVLRQQPSPAQVAASSKKGKSRPVVGVSTTTLSNRFSNLKKTPAALKKPGNKAKSKGTVSVTLKPKRTAAALAEQKIRLAQKKLLQKRQQKVSAAIRVSKANRQQVVQKNRKGLQVPAKKEAKKAPVKAKNGKKKDTKKEKPLNGEELDTEMDAYWHAAGKGPDPKQIQLDRQMEEYWSTKPKTDAPQPPQ